MEDAGLWREAGIREKPVESVMKKEIFRVLSTTT
jgi:hypothetical protein